MLESSNSKVLNLLRALVFHVVSLVRHRPHRHLSVTEQRVVSLQHVQVLAEIQRPAIELIADFVESSDDAPRVLFASWLAMAFSMFWTCILTTLTGRGT